jgi:hypothetical protein
MRNWLSISLCFLSLSIALTPSYICLFFFICLSFFKFDRAIIGSARQDGSFLS